MTTDAAGVAPLERRVGRLSPLNLTGLLHREFDYSPNPQAAEKKKRKSARYVSAYACPVCDDLHRWEDDAENCCQAGAEKEPSADEYKTLCPVCGSENDSAAEASDCCLWKDLDQHTRHAIAQRVEQGSTWARELCVWPPNVEVNRHGTG